MQKKIIAIALSAFVLAGCDTMGESVGLGAAVGAGGAMAVGGNPVTGAVVGGGVGAICHQTNNC